MVREEDLGDVVSITVLDDVEDDALEIQSPLGDEAEPPVEEFEETQSPMPHAEGLRLPEALWGHGVGPDEGDPWETTVFDSEGDEEPAGPEGDDEAFSGSLATRVMAFLHADAESVDPGGSDGRDADSGSTRPGDLVARLTEARTRLESFRAMAARIHGARNGSRHRTSVLEVPRRRAEYGGVVEIPKA